MKSDILKKTISDSHQFIEKNRCTMNKLFDIDNQILSLIRVRSSIILNELDNVEKIFSFKRTFGVDAQDVFNEYTLKSFDSNMVKDTIAKIRELFFDDEKKEHRIYNCVDINIGTDFISFTFSNGGKEFSVNIPHRIEYDSNAILNREYFGNVFRITYRTSNIFEESSPGTYNISDIRKDTDDFINNKTNKTREYLGRGKGLLEEISSIMSREMFGYTNPVWYNMSESI